VDLPDAVVKKYPSHNYASLTSVPINHPTPLYKLRGSQGCQKLLSEASRVRSEANFVRLLHWAARPSQHTSIGNPVQYPKNGYSVTLTERHRGFSHAGDSAPKTTVRATRRSIERRLLPDVSLAPSEHFGTVRSSA